MRWEDVDTDPCGQRARALRSARLDHAFRNAHLTSRIDTATSLARGQRVIDLGCVGHSIDRIGQPGWLHANVAEAAEECLGVDIHSAGIERMQELGYSALVHDITGDSSPITSGGLFDLVIGGEIIEHIADLGALLRFGCSVLKPGGLLLVTTPNPYAPWRVRAGQLGRVSENCDHVCLVHPSGMAELCDRMNIRLEAAWSADWKSMAPSNIGGSLHAWGAVVRDRARAIVRSPGPDGIRRRLQESGREHALGWAYLTPIDLLTLRNRRRHNWLSETAIYLIRMAEPYEPTRDELAAFSQWTGKSSRC